MSLIGISTINTLIAVERKTEESTYIQFYAFKKYFSEDIILRSPAPTSTIRLLNEAKN